ncbi:hypothetical protein MHPYR_570007 [uncultured Mycobacterium sp.]|uniref:Uncharacterized protein n=1 Tax=uncultured Mycobacterium sp. TaxID=171292 RepID=A0A1Y5PI48_9MYCO|nr:hypothetical protein MHPYR_570007 [uncultured Mycobacterium sp.]
MAGFGLIFRRDVTVADSVRGELALRGKAFDGQVLGPAVIGLARG